MFLGLHSRPKALRHFMACPAVLYRLLALLRLFNIKDKLARVAAYQHHCRNYTENRINAFTVRDNTILADASQITFAKDFRVCLKDHYLATADD